MVVDETGSEPRFPFPPDDDVMTPNDMWTCLMVCIASACITVAGLYLAIKSVIRFFF